MNPLVPLHIPDPPGQQLTYKLVYVDPLVGLVKPVTITAVLPVPGTVGQYTPFVGVSGVTLR